MHWKLSIWQWRLKERRKERRIINDLKNGVRQVDKEYAPRIAAAKEEYAEIVFEDYWEALSPYQPKLNYIMGRKLLDKAQKLGIEIPADEDGWFSDQYDCHSERTYKALSPMGETKLQLMIRKQKRESIEWWVSRIIIPILALLVAIIALLKK